MELTTPKPIGVMAVILDAATRQSEVIDIDRLRLYALVVNHKTESMQFAFVWGGYSSAGRFYISEELAASHRSIQANVRCRSCSDNPQTTTHIVGCENVIWEGCTKDKNGNPILDHGEAFVAKVMLEYNKIEDIVNGGWNFRDGIELIYKGQVVFSKGPTPPTKQQQRALTESGTV